MTATCKSWLVVESNLSHTGDLTQSHLAGMFFFLKTCDVDQFFWVTLLNPYYFPICHCRHPQRQKLSTASAHAPTTQLIGQHMRRDRDQLQKEKSVHCLCMCPPPGEGRAITLRFGLSLRPQVSGLGLEDLPKSLLFLNMRGIYFSGFLSPSPLSFFFKGWV